jgi:hypothetical protein
MLRIAEFSVYRTYRYALWRIWQPEAPRVLFIGLNPSTADDRLDDPTVRRCLGYARSWGYGSLALANLFAYRSTNPADLRVAADPIGPLNDRWLKDLSREADLVVAAWGNHGRLGQRWKAAAAIREKMYCLGITKLGQPCHPLYLKKSICPIRWVPELGERDNPSHCT